MTPRPTRTVELLASLAVRHRGATLPLPADPYPPVKLVQVDVSGEQEQPRGDEFLASPRRTSKPATGDGPGALGADVVATLSHLGQVINQRLQFGPFRGEECFAVEGCGESLVFRGHASVFPTPGKQLDGHPLLSPPSLWRGLGVYRRATSYCCLPRLGRLYSCLSVGSRVEALS
jgi:hypothetical protein